MEKEIILQNPWWKDKNAIENDEKLKIALSKNQCSIIYANLRIP